MNRRSVAAMWGLWLLALAPALAQSNVTLIPAGAVWRYLDNGSDQGTAWRATSFNDSSWASGPAELGYGDGGEATTINGGPSGNFYITTYFRRAFTLPPGASFSTLTVRLVRDDGGVVYLNGVEIFRSNMPGGTIGYTTLASSTVGGSDESTFFSATVPASALLFGTNVIAVEIHQREASSSDVSFNLELTGLTGGATPPTIVTPPVSVARIEGATATFLVTASGPGPIGYRWQRNGVTLTNGGRISGATLPALTIANLTTNEAGAYSAVATNAGGPATSAAATLTVLPAVPAMADDFDPGVDLTQWLAFGGETRATNYGGSTSGSNSLWFGGNGSRFAISRPINASNGLTIRFQVRLGDGSGPNWDAAEVPNDGVVMEYSVNGGATWILASTANSTNNYRWNQLGVGLSSAAFTNNLLLRWRQQFNEGSCCDHWALDDVLVLAAPAPPAIVFPPQSQTSFIGETVTLVVGASGSMPAGYQWEWNGMPLPGATNATLVLPALTGGEAGSYRVTITNPYGAATSVPALLTVEPLPTSVFDDFDPGIDATQWAAFSSTVAATNHGGSTSGANSLWFGGNDVRQAVTRPLDTSEGGYISFNLRLSDGSANNWRFGFLPDHGIVFEYSIDRGTSWYLIATYDTPDFYAWTLREMFIPPGARSPRTQFRWRQLEHYGSSYSHWALDDVEIVSTPLPPIIQGGPADQVVVTGDSATFTVQHGGSEPMDYQWQFNGMDIPGAIKPALTLNSITTNMAGLYRLRIHNAEGDADSREARLSVIDVSGDVFRIASLTTNGSAVVEDTPFIGSSAGGLAVSDARVFYSGTTGTVSYGLTNLDNPAAVAALHRAIVTDLRSGRMFVLGNGANPVTNNNAIANSILEINGRTGLPTGGATALTAPIDLRNNYASIGFFSGVGRAAVVNGTNAYSILLPSGRVLDHGRIGALPRVYPDSWAYYGVVEYFNNAVWLARVRDSRTITRTRVPDGYSEDILFLSFLGPSLGDMSAFTAAPGLGRWYYHYQFNSIFGGGTNLTGYAEGVFTNQGPTSAIAIVTQPRGRTIVSGASADLEVVATGWPLHYQWRRDGIVLPGETASRLRLLFATPADAGNYSVVISDGSLSITSLTAAVRVVPPSRVRVYDDPNYVDTYGGYYSESDSVQATLHALGHYADAFTDLGASLTPGRVLLFPSLAYGNPAPALGAGTRAALRDFVESGGLAVIHGGGGGARFLNDVFGLSLASSYNFSSSNGITAQAAGTAFANGPAFLPYNSTTYGLPTNSLPLGARSIYESGGVSLVTILPLGSGRVVFIGWNWENAWPLGAQDSGWIEVLNLALQETEPPVAAPPLIAVQPEDRPAVVGVDVELRVAAYGSAPLSYQWLKDGAALPGATANTLRIVAPPAAATNDYAVVVSNPFGTVTSRQARVTVRVSRGIVSYLRDQYTPYTDFDTPILHAGFRPQRVTDIATHNLAPVSVLLLDTSYSGGAWPALLNRLPAITAWVVGGGRVIIHDSTGYAQNFGQIITSATPMLLGAGNSRVRSGYNSDVDLAGPPGASLVTAGPHGSLNDTNLDGAIFYTGVPDEFLAPGMTAFLRDGNAPTQNVAVAYGIGAGHVFYSTLFVSYVLDEALPATPVVRSIYLPNVIEHVVAQSPTGAVRLVQPPLDQGVLAGGTATLTAYASGLPPLRYQWQFNGNDLPGATNFSLVLSNVTAELAGDYAVRVTNPLGATNSPPGRLTVIDARPFKIATLGTGGAQVINADPLTGDDRGGIALSTASVFLTGDNATARYNADNLAGGAVAPLRHEAFVSNLRTETAYTLAQGGVPLDYGGGIVDSLIALDGNTGALTTNMLILSTPIPFQNYASGIFSGYDAAVLHDGTRAWRIDFPTGLVTDLGLTTLPFFTYTESWARWGVAEYFDGAMWIVQVRDSQTITRTRVPDGFTTNVATFSNLGDMASFTVSPARDRWYFHYESGAQFGNAAEALGYASMTWDKPPQIAQFINRALNEDATIGPLPFTVSDDLTPASNLVVTVRSSNTNLLPAAGIVLAPLPARAVTFTPLPDRHGTAVVTLAVSDAIGNTTTAAVNIIVRPVNDPPSFTRGTNVTVTEDSPFLSLPAWATQITAGPQEPEQTFAFIVGNSHPGLFAVMPFVYPSGELTFQPAPDAHGTATLTIGLADDGGTANGGTNVSPAQTFTITILPANDPPQSFAQSIATPEDTPVAVTLFGADIDGDALTYRVLTPPAHGALGGTGASLIYTPATNYHGPDSFVFVANDGTLDSPPATISLTVSPVNDPPVPVPQALATDEDTPLALVPLATDADGDRLTYFLIGPPTNGILAHTGTNFIYTPAANYHGPDSLTFLVTDGRSLGDDVVIALEVRPVNDAPVAGPVAPVTVNENASVAITLAGSDVERSPLHYVIVTPPAHGTLVPVASSSQVLYTPAPGYDGPDSFTYRVNDGLLDSAPATVTITVLNVNSPPDARARVLNLVYLLPPPAEGVIIAGRSNDAPVILDASLSTDPDGDALEFAWFRDGGLVPFALGVTVTNPFTAGAHTISLAAHDGELPAIATLELEIITPAAALEAVIVLLAGSDLPRNRVRPLEASLKAAMASFDRGNFTSGQNQLHALQNKLRAQVAPSDPELAAQLNHILAAIGDALAR